MESEHSGQRNVQQRADPVVKILCIVQTVLLTIILGLMVVTMVGVHDMTSPEGVDDMVTRAASSPASTEAVGAMLKSAMSDTATAEGVQNLLNNVVHNTATTDKIAELVTAAVSSGVSAEVVENLLDKVMNNTETAAGVANLGRNALTVAMFGDNDTMIASLMTGLFQSDFSGMGLAMTSMLPMVADVFELRAAGNSDCSDEVFTCPPNNGTGYISYGCQDSHAYVFCDENNVGEQQTCRCREHLLVDLMDKIQSVMTQVGKIQKVGPAVRDEPTGLLRPDSILGYAQQQTDTSAWKNTAQNCVDFATNVQAVSWKGAGAAEADDWDTSGTVSDITDYMKSWCGDIVAAN